MKEINCFLEARVKFVMFYKHYPETILNIASFPAIIWLKT